MSRFPTRSLRSLSAATRSISSSLWLHHAHSLVAAAEKKTSLMQRSNGFGHGVVVSKICYVQYSDWLCQGFGLCDITIDCALSCDMWLLQTNEPILATVSWKWGRRPFSGPSQGQWDLFQVPCQPRSSGGFACLGSHPGLANCTGASIEGVTVARCTGCSSKLCLLFGPFQPGCLQQTRCPCRLSHSDLYSRGGCTRITTFGTAMNYIVEFS